MGESGLISELPGRRGHFVLESGHHGDLWLDLDRLFLHPRRLWPAVRRLAESLSGHSLDAICGPLVGGGLLAQLCAIELDVELWYAERSAAPDADVLYSASYTVPSTLDLQGRRVAVVDDVINAGSAVRATLADLRERGAVPVALGALLVLGDRADELAAATRLTLTTVERLDAPVWEPSECPLCAAGLPLEHR